MVGLSDGGDRKYLRFTNDFGLIGKEDGGEPSFSELFLESVLFFVDFDGLSFEFHVQMFIILI